MKKIVWYSKIVFLAAVTFATFGGYADAIVRAQGDREDYLKNPGLCNLDYYCSGTHATGCSCGQRACNGCFIQNGDTGCGKCDRE